MMYQKSNMPGEGSTGQKADTVGTDLVSGATIPHFEGQRNPQIEGIPVALGGPVHWATCDALHTLARELVRQGLVEDDDRLTDAIGASWAKMVTQATYFPGDELAALEVGRG